MDAREVAEAFVDAINAGDVDSLCGLMAPEHVFIDSDGTEVRDNEGMRKGWKEYFTLVPDYRIHVRDTFEHGGTVGLFGTAEGTFSKDGTIDPENHWEAPAAWRAVIENELILEWQVYVNPTEMLEILNEMGAM